MWSRKTAGAETPRRLAVTPRLAGLPRTRVAAAPRTRVAPPPRTRVAPPRTCERGGRARPRFLTVEQGMNPRAIDGHGRTPLEVARRAQRDEVVAFLEQVNPEAAPASKDDASCMTTTFGQEDAPCSELNCVVA